MTHHQANSQHSVFFRSWHSKIDRFWLLCTFVVLSSFPDSTGPFTITMFPFTTHSRLYWSLSSPLSLLHLVAPSLLRRHLFFASPQPFTFPLSVLRRKRVINRRQFMVAQPNSWWNLKVKLFGLVFLRDLICWLKSLPWPDSPDLLLRKSYSFPTFSFIMS